MAHPDRRRYAAGQAAQVRRIWRGVAVAGLACLAACGGGGSAEAPPAGTGPSFTVSGSVKGTLSPGLVVQINGGSDLSVDVDGSFTFDGGVASGSSYDVTIQRQPTAQSCSIDAGGHGVMANRPVADVSISCSVVTLPVVALSGTVNRLLAPGLTMSLRVIGRSFPEQELNIDEDGDFAFDPVLLKGDRFVIRLTAPPRVVCNLLAGGAGIAGTTPPVQVECGPLPSPDTPTQRISGTIRGLASQQQVKLLLNGRATLDVQNSGTFTFNEPLPRGTVYQVAVLESPGGQDCGVSRERGVVTTADVTNVDVTCVPTFVPELVTGSVVNLFGSGLKLQQGLDTITLDAGTAAFTFPTPPLNGLYNVRVVQQPSDPSQVCEPLGNSNAGLLTVGQTVRLRCTRVQLPPPTTGLALDRERLEFNAEEGGTVAPQTVFAWLNGVATGQAPQVTIPPDLALFKADYRTVAEGIGGLLITPPPPDRLGPGVYSGSIGVSLCRDPSCQAAPGSQRTIQVSYTVRASTPQSALRVSEHGIAFAAVPGAQRLSRSLTFSGSAAAMPWAAATDAPWLTVTPAGTNGTPLRVTADPIGLPDGYHQATITLRAADATRARPETVRVGLYKSADARAPGLLEPPAFNAPVLADPTRPLFYQINGKQLVAHHAYTGRRTATLDLPDTVLKQFAIAADGSRMYVYDGSAIGQTRRHGIVVVDLDAWAVHHAYDLPQIDIAFTDPTNVQLVPAVVDGRRVLVLGNAALDDVFYLPSPKVRHPVVDADTGAMLGHLNGLGSQANVLPLTASRHHPSAYAHQTLSNGGLLRIDLRSNSRGNVFGVPVGTQLPFAELGPLAVSPDGLRLALQARFPPGLFSGAAQEFVWDNGSLQGGRQIWDPQEPALALEYDNHGRLLVRHTPLFSTADTSDVVDLFDASGAVLLRVANTTAFNGTGPAVAADGLTLLFGNQLKALPP